MSAQAVPGYSSVLKPFPLLPIQLLTTTPRNCKDLFVDGWKVKTAADPETGECVRTEHFVGPEKMANKTEQTYL